MKILSVDPGKNGAIVLADYSLGLNKVQVNLYKTPLLKNGKEYDIRALQSIFNNEFDFAVIEDVHSIFNSSAKSNFQFGMGVGIMRALVETSMRPYLLVPPKTWQKVAWQGLSKSSNPKANSSIAAHRLFPNINFIPKGSRKEHDGFIDAILIGYYVYTKNNSTIQQQ